ncbi:MAG TPA: hypothetical protein VLW83_07650, partial [Candidatus Acidoferrales bacterium]|nr:hypothetical protein [Candidatus Acidoferrales bacterium]
MRNNGPAQTIDAASSEIFTPEISNGDSRSHLDRIATSLFSRRVIFSALIAFFFFVPSLARAQAPVTDDTYSQRGREWTNGSAPL